MGLKILSLLFAVGPARAAESVGPDAFGYVGIVIPNNLRNISATGAPLPNTDDSISDAIPWS